MYKIGVIEDTKIDFNKISRRLRKFGVSIDKQISVSRVEIFEEDETFDMRAIVNRVLMSVSAGDYDSLIIDESITGSNNKCGSLIFNEIEQIIPSFPKIMLTNYVDSVEKDIKIDIDKIYSKMDFFVKESALVKRVAQNLFNSKEQVSVLDRRVKELQMKMQESDNENYEEIVYALTEVEYQKAKYIPNLEYLGYRGLSNPDYTSIFEIIEKVERIMSNE